MNQNNNFKIIIGLIIILLALTLFLINQTPQRHNINNDTISSDYIKVSADGAILFNTTGYNVTDISETITNKVIPPFSDLIIFIAFSFRFI